jgi:aspartyl protease family protein
MSNETVAAVLMSLLVLILPLSSLIARRPPLGQTLRYGVAWVGIFALLLVLFSFRDDLRAGWNTLFERFDPSAPKIVGENVRIRQDEGGHFSAKAMVNGREVLFLIDTGATTSMMSRGSANAANVPVSETGFAAIVETANGTTAMRRARIESLKVGSIVREDHAILVSEDMGEMNMLGMNFLSSLKSWRVEGKDMVLTP